MKLQSFPITALIATIGLLQACAPVYIPSARHTHQLDSKGEVSGAVLAGTNGVDAQGAYAISDHIGVAAAVSFARNEEQESHNYHRHSYGEVAIEYFRPFGKMWRFELLGGGGLGSATSVDNYVFAGSNREVQATGKYNKLFLQSNIGLEINWVETGPALRLGHVTFTEFETSSTTYDESDSGTFFEPAFFVKLGTDNIKVEGQLGTASLLQEEQDVLFDYRPLLVSIGLHFNLTPSQ